ncbi:putative ATP-grasp target RiPP [Kribbella sp. VKM Ac-2571]|uniref:putative ATP-grasp-modified RiPP n=1 Tax=Kribbella sp. VKM Ac-2571 TaxID=2512222 RepID=UPI00105EB8A1|nr:putative ATP-grasp-modified RiPP [Kribbella sp. VKM Ac-2571]TDO67156.1 putative ATP-grasp target RiPP [Kribbella sp. VKM Ac-2571]
MTAVPLRPWGVRRAVESDLLSDGHALSLTAVTIDPLTQLGIYRDPSGQIVQAGPPKHGTQRAQFKSLPTGTGDGSRPGNPDDTKVVEYVPD